MSPRYSCPHDGQHASRRLAQRTISAPSGSLAVEYTGSSPCSTTPRSRTVWRHAPVRRTCCSQRSRLGSRARSGRGGSRRPAHRRAAPSPKDPPHAHKTDTSAREHADARDSTIRRFRSLVSLVMNVRTRSSRCPSLGADARRSRAFDTYPRPRRCCRTRSVGACFSEPIGRGREAGGVADQGGAPSVSTRQAPARRAAR
jgi:hypothetical protein